jgi:hypothetical protein
MLNPNPFGPQQDPSGLFSSLNARQRLLKNIRAAKVDDQIFQVIQNAFEEALSKENVVLSRAERQYLLAHVMKQVLTDMVNKLDNTTKN